MQCPDFDPIDPGETEVFGFDFSLALATDETASGTLWDITLASGVDATPAVRLSGVATLTGAVTAQRIAGAQSGAVYRLRATIATSLGNTLSLWAYLRTSKF